MNRLITPQEFDEDVRRIWRECEYRIATEICEEERHPDMARWLDDGGAGFNGTRQ